MEITDWHSLKSHQTHSLSTPHSLGCQECAALCQSHTPKAGPQGAGCWRQGVTDVHHNPKDPSCSSVGFFYFYFVGDATLACSARDVQWPYRRGEEMLGQQPGCCKEQSSLPSPIETRTGVHNDPSYLCKLNLNQENSCLLLTLERNRHLWRLTQTLSGPEWPVLPTHYSILTGRGAWGIALS